MARTPPPPPPLPPPLPPPPSPQPNVQVVQTDPGLAQNMAVQPGLTTSTIPPQELLAETIDVNDQVRYQQFRGLGAAMTDSSAYVINGMPSAGRAALLDDLFGQPSSGKRARSDADPP